MIAVACGVVRADGPLLPSPHRRHHRRLPRRDVSADRVRRVSHRRDVVSCTQGRRRRVAWCWCVTPAPKARAISSASEMRRCHSSAAGNCRRSSRACGAIRWTRSTAATCRERKRRPGACTTARHHAVTCARQLREMHFGRWEGLSWDEVAEQFPRDSPNDG